MTPRQRQALCAIESHYAVHGRPPSYKELGFRLGVSASMVHKLVSRLAMVGACHVARRRGYRTEIRLIDRTAEFTTPELIAALASRQAPVTVPHGENEVKDKGLALAA
jgi:hypothetical protein